MTAPIVIPDPQDSADNQVLPFRLEAQDVRGRAVRLGTVVDQILSAHAYPDAVGALLGEWVALTALLGSILKGDGLLTIQVKSDGPINFLVADYRNPGELRGYARIDAEKVAALGDEAGFTTLLGKGYMALTLDPGGDMEAYQGIVELEGESLSDCARGYFERSEQTPTDLRVSAGRDPVTGHWRAGGIMVQHLARGEAGQERILEGAAEEEWRRASLLMETVKADELLDPTLPLSALLYRLYHEDGVRVFDTVPMQRGCRCSRERLLGVIRTFSGDDQGHMTVDGKIAMTCEFCARTFDFSPAEIAVGA